jgi:hypothetical protein
MERLCHMAAGLLPHRTLLDASNAYRRPVEIAQREKPTTTVIGRTTSLARYSPPFSLIARRTLDKNCLA